MARVNGPIEGNSFTFELQSRIVEEQARTIKALRALVEQLKKQLEEKR